MATDTPADSSGSLGGLSLSDDDIHDGAALQGDTWIEELECALLADCDSATLKKICEGKRIPDILRPDYWRTLLALNDAGKVKLSSEFDLNNQSDLRHDCEQLVEEISATLSPEPLPDSEKLRLRSDFESTLTTYVKARPELEYVSGNGWTDILKVLFNLQLNDIQLYQMFYRIVDRYIPRDLSPVSSPSTKRNGDVVMSKEPNNLHKTATSQTSSGEQQTAISTKTTKTTAMQQQSEDSRKKNADHEKSVQAYHLLRLLIQYHDPELCSILDSKKVTPNLYVKDWFCSLFARSCTPKLALHMWDIHFKMADPFLIFFAAIVMVVNASDELKKSNLVQADMLNALKKMPSLLEEDDVEDLYYLVSNHYTSTTPRSIRAYSHLFFMDTFGATYMGGSESPELDGSSSMIDLKTSRLTSSLDLSQYLCLPIVPAEIFALDTAARRASPINESSPTHSASQQSDDSPSTTAQSDAVLNQTLRYFLVDCRPAEQYNAGHLTKAFHLDCSLMLREPSSFATAVQALLEIQRQVVASKSSTGGQHLCFIGSGQDEEDRYVNMVVASFLQRYQKYVSIVVGGFDAIHDYVKSKTELKDSFDTYIVDHNEELCKACCSRSPEAFERFKANAAAAAAAAAATANKSQQGNRFGLGSSQSLFASTTSFLMGGERSAASALSKFTASNPQATATAQQLAQSGVSMFDKFTTAFVSKSSVIKERLVETLNNTALPTANTLSAAGSQGHRSHVSSQDRLGPRYTGASSRYHELEPDKQRPSGLLSRQRSAEGSGTELEEGPCQEIQIEQWQRENEIMALYKCAQIKGALQYPGYIGLNRTHLWILREIPHNKGFASIAAKRPLDMIVQVTSKRRQPDLIIFRYGYTNAANKLASSADDRTPAASGEPKAQQVVQTQPAGTANVRKPVEAQQLNKSLPTIIASDHLHIPQAFEVIRLIKREIVRIMDESSHKDATSKTNKADLQTDTPTASANKDGRLLGTDMAPVAPSEKRGGMEPMEPAAPGIVDPPEATPTTTDAGAKTTERVVGENEASPSDGMAGADESGVSHPVAEDSKSSASNEFKNAGEPSEKEEQ